MIWGGVEKLEMNLLVVRAMTLSTDRCPVDFFFLEKGLHFFYPPPPDRKWSSTKLLMT